MNQLSKVQLNCSCYTTKDEGGVDSLPTYQLTNLPTYQLTILPSSGKFSTNNRTFAALKF
ncbi:MAG: hypothetical protein WCP32_12670 [Bacteroidota bacterium]